MTNADMIRSASDEELVQYLIDRVDMIRKGDDPQVWIGNFGGTARTEKEAETMELAWLRSEAQEGA
ncbi:MAG: hypothetical protein K2I96_12170 [Lachnospiraceae bacterium]|nr:hypothetical protein [Lachnospiraceae bacterium]